MNLLNLMRCMWLFRSENQFPITFDDTLRHLQARYFFRLFTAEEPIQILRLFQAKIFCSLTSSHKLLAANILTINGT